MVKDGQVVQAPTQGGIQLNTDIRATNGTVYKAGQIVPQGTVDGGQVVNPNFNGKWYEQVSPAAAYEAQYGSGSFSSIPTYNAGDISSAIGLMTQYKQPYGSATSIPTSALDPTLAGYVNPNAGFQNTGSTASFTQAPTVGAATGVQQTTPTTPPIDTRLQLQPGEDPTAYNTRVASQFANLPAPGTTSATGVTNTAKPAGYNGTIDSSMMNGAPSTNFQTNTYNPQITPPMSGLTPPSDALGAQGTKAQGEVDSLRNLNTQTLGESAYQTQQNQAFGVDAATQAVNEFDTQLGQLDKEAAAIPLSIQSNFQGRGVTGAGIAPVQTAAIRNNTIQKLNVAVSRDAAANKLALAQSNADKAVKAKFDPIKEQIKVATANLNLILNSPSYSAEEKKQATAQLAYQKQLDAAIDAQTLEEKRKYDIHIAAASNIASFTPTAQYKTAAQAIQAISNASSYEQALQIATTTGLMSAPQESWSKPYLLGGDYVQRNEQTGQVRVAVNPAIGTDPSNPTSSTPKLAAAASEKVATLNTLKDLANTVATTGESSNWAGVGGFYSGTVNQFLAKNLGYGTQAEEELRNNIANITATLAKARAGTSFTEGEKALLEQYTPTINDSALVIKGKLASLQAYIQREIANTYAVAGGSQSGAPATNTTSGTTASGISYTVQP